MAKREYIEKNRQWLADKAQETGVKPLPKGIYYKIIASGDKDGRKPSARSVVTAHYTGRTINGRTFDSSRGGSPLAARLSDLITGWSIAMQQPPTTAGFRQLLTEKTPTATTYMTTTMLCHA